MKPKFTVRVYGILINEHREVLVSDEFRFGHFFTKFPGGGVEHGEGLIDALQREFMEEMDQPINVLEYFFHNENIQPSAFKTNERLIKFVNSSPCNKF